MPAYRLCDEQGEIIGAIILDRPSIEREIVGGHPKLDLQYSATLTEIVSFSLMLVPEEDTSVSVF